MSTTDREQPTQERRQAKTQDTKMAAPLLRRADRNNPIRAANCR